MVSISSTYVVIKELIQVDPERVWYVFGSIAHAFAESIDIQTF